MKTMSFVVLVGLMQSAAFADSLNFMGAAQQLYDAHNRRCYRDAKSHWDGTSNDLNEVKREMARFNRLYASCLDQRLKEFDRQNPARYAAIVAGAGSQHLSHYSGYAWNFPDLSSAVAAAETECLNEGGVGCEVIVFSRNGCIAHVEAGWSNYFGSGASESEARTVALEKCPTYENCEVKFTNCVSSAK